MEQENPRRMPVDEEERERYLDHSYDLVARIRAARDQYQRELEAFGDVSEYEIRKIYGQRTDITYDDVKETPTTTPQTNRESTADERPTLDASSSGRRQGVLDFKAEDDQPRQKEE